MVPMTDDQSRWTEPMQCPRCKTMIEGPKRALSRVDNATLVCSSCGHREGEWVFERPDHPLPPLTEPIPYMS